MLLEIGTIIVGILAGAIIGYFVQRQYYLKAHKESVAELRRKAELDNQEAKLKAKKIIDEAELKADKMLAKAEQRQEDLKQQKIREVKNKFAKLKSELEEEKSRQKIKVKEERAETESREKALHEKEKALQTKSDRLRDRKKDLSNLSKDLEKKEKVLYKRREELEKRNEEIILELENISRLTEAEAKKQLLEAVKAKAETDALAVMREKLEEAKSSANKNAKKIVLQTIQRMCAEFAIENTVSLFKLENDDLKGQIIGREGRNIRALEQETGVEIIVDDTPETIIISCYDPYRREICRMALKQLIADGRIHPTRIEEVVEKVKEQLKDHIMEIGERAIIELDIHGLNNELVQLVGRMRFRSSYGQNLLKHSLETATLCGIMAAEMGMSARVIKLAKRAGLLHDIGKVVEDDSELSHALLGKKVCEKFGEEAPVCNAVGAHHDEIEMDHIISPVVQSCDAISGARPGARREIMESYLNRIGELEELAMSFDGVMKAYALQAGRELRVIVESEKVNDNYADDLSYLISNKIEEEMQYPGQVKVTVIREKRAVAIAR